MPLSRTLSGRSKPRPPQIPSKSPATPTFHPPSHYAAAAGIEYTRPDSRRKGSSGSSNTSNCGISSSSFFPNSHDRNTSASYPSETESAAASSFEFRRPGVTAEESIQSTKTAADRQRRRSLVNELPQMEAQLLPSLRDTIDRMTRASPGHIEEYHQLPENTAPSELPSISYTPGSPTPPFYPRTPRSRSSSQSRYAPSMSTPRQDLRKGSYLQTSPYMSSLKNPEVRTQDQVEMSPTPSSQKRLSLRSPHTKIQKRTASPRSTPFHSEHSSESSQEHMNKADPSTTRIKKCHRRTRSRSDPGTAPPKAASLQMHRSPYSSKQVPFTSNIPRPRKMDRQSDESDLEQRYEAELQSRRRLVVTNATIGPPSSSESEKEEYTAMDQPYTGSRSAYSGPIGLGFDLGTNENPYGRRTLQNTPQESNGYRHSHMKPSPPPRSPLRPCYPPVAVNRYPDQVMPSCLRSEAVERRVALYHAINGLDDREQDMPETESSEYVGEDGFAISSSWNKTDESFEDPVHEGHDYQEQHGQGPSRKAPTGRYSTTPTTPKHREKMSSQARHHQTPKFENSFNSRQNYDLEAQVFYPESRSKISSRSPVMTSIDPPPLPAALKRHSVYHRSPKPRTNNTSGSYSPYEPHMSRFTPRQETPHPPDPAVLAARERQAYGIPESNSEDVLLRPQESYSDAAQVESDLSSESSIYLDEEEGSELSIGAESLLKGLDARGHRPIDPGPYHDPNRPRSRLEDYEAENLAWGSQPAVCDHPRPPIGHQPSDSIREAQQLIIDDLYFHQQDYVERLQTFLEVFILPLRYQNSRRWISGIPEKVCRLFDWLEDIMVLHQQVVGTLEDHRQAKDFNVGYLADALRCLVTRFEVYQPYLVKHVEVIKLIEDLMEDQHDEFGEFVRLQESRVLPEGQGFRQFLLEPVGHLDSFPTYYVRLLEATPKDGEAYLPILLLVHATKTVTKVLKEVQVREEEYAKIKRLLKRIHGLPSGIRLAMRNRRLLHSGSLWFTEENLTIGSGSISKPLGAFPDPKDSTQTGLSVVSSPSSSGGSVGSEARRSMFLPSLKSSKLIKRSLLRKSSFMKPTTTVDPPSHKEYQISVFVFNDLALLATGEACRPGPLPTCAASNSTENDDCLGLSCLPELGCIRVIGAQMAYSEQTSEGSSRPLLVLEVLPLDATSSIQPSDNNKQSPAPRMRTLHLYMSPEKTGSTDPAPNAAQDVAIQAKERQEHWLSAFQTCSRMCLSLLSSSTSANGAAAQASNTLDPETYPTVISLLVSGLPIPKSPSTQDQQIDFALAGAGEEVEMSKEGEREERGWWSLRFQQVYQELKRAETESQWTQR